MGHFPSYKQLDAMDCGPTCLRMVAAHYGKKFSLQTLRQKSHLTRGGVSMLGISDAAEEIGFRTLGVKITWNKLSKETPLPCIVHWEQRHFVVVYKIKNNKVLVADPASGKQRYSKHEFLKKWGRSVQEDQPAGMCLLLEPTQEFYKTEPEKIQRKNFSFLFSYMRNYRKLIAQLITGLVVASLLQLIFPFLTQQIVDFGINNRDLGFIYLILIAQFVLMISRMSVDFIRGWILLHLGTRVNVSLISDFLIKLMKLPISFFDAKITGDLLQRIGDHRRIEVFLTSATLNILFSFFNLIVFGLVLALYSLQIFWVFLAGSILYTFWVFLFMKRRKRYDQIQFKQRSENQNSLIQLFTGMQEIKLHNIEKQKRWEWEIIQAQIFKVNVKSLSLAQYQQAGATFINESKNILITILAAASVIHGNMTLGMMLAVQYILGQLNSPLDQMIGFLQKSQDARLSLERLAEIHDREDEEVIDEIHFKKLSEEKSINIENLAFQYEGPRSPKVLNHINLVIPQAKTTAIVGVSGSGKTTLIKLLLGFYKPIEGNIKIGGIPLRDFSKQNWRSYCGAVMQDGFIFADTISKNITMGDEEPNVEKLVKAARLSNIKDFIESLPGGYNTQIGSNGLGLSQGQKQRLLIARAVYKDPEYLFFDEATNSLDAKNEKIIMDHFNNYFQGKTVVVVAHRLSTVTHADQIIVLDRGKIAEQGTHKELTQMKGVYFNLVKDQLELGK